MPRKILVASYTSSITTISFEAAVSPPSLSVVSSLEVGDRPSWITPHETDTSIVFTANEQPNGMVKAIRIDLNSGEGKVVANMHIGGDDPCHILVSGGDLITTNYGSGNVSIIPLSPSTPYLPPKPSQVINFPGYDHPPNVRQEISHPHQVLPHPIGEELLIPDLGSDKLWRLKKKESGWVVSGDVDMRRGGGPRHGVFVGNTLYTLLELSNTLTSHQLPPLPEPPVVIDAASTLSDPPINPINIDPPPMCAEVLSPPISAAYPTPYIYVTNRNDPSPEGDILSIFEPSDTGSLKLINELRTGLNHLRGIAFDEEGRYLIAGGTFGGGVKMFERVDNGRNLKEVAHLKDVERPTGFYWLPTA